MDKFRNLFPLSKPLIGMIHVQALPGTPAHRYPLNQITDLAVHEAVLYQKLGFTAVMLENMHDLPYLNKSVGAEVTACMTRVAIAVRQAVDLPIGIQILAAANREALAVAQAADLQFIRAEGYVFGHVADEGYIDACAGELLRYRKAIGAEHIAIFSDIKKKHSAHALTSDVNIGETASAAEFFLSDGIIVTGSSTGKAADPDDLKAVKSQCGLPLLIGSGITTANLSQYWQLADGFIIGSDVKESGIWSNPLSSDRCAALVQAAGNLRK